MARICKHKCFIIFTSGNRLRAPRSKRVLGENIVEFEPDLEPFPAETHVQTNEGSIQRIETQPKSIGGLQIREVQLPMPRENFASIHPQRHIQPAESLPTVFAGEAEHISIRESKRTKAS